MNARVGLLACLIVVVGGYVALWRLTPRMVGSLEITITPPSADVPRELTAYSGIWESNPGGDLPSRLIVEEIHPNWATIVYTWADHPTGEPKPGWARVRAKVVPGGKLRWAFPHKFTVDLAHDGMSLEGKREQAGKLVTFSLRKAEVRIPE